MPQQPRRGAQGSSQPHDQHLECPRLCRWRLVRAPGAIGHTIPSTDQLSRLSRPPSWPSAPCPGTAGAGQSEPPVGTNPPNGPKGHQRFVTASQPISPEVFNSRGPGQCLIISDRRPASGDTASSAASGSIYGSNNLPIDCQECSLIINPFPPFPEHNHCAVRSRGLKRSRFMTGRPWSGSPAPPGTLPRHHAKARRPSA